MSIKSILGATAVAALAFAFVSTPAVTAQEKAGKVYYFGSHTKHSNVSFTSEADIETIVGTTNTVGGQTWLDLKDGKGKANITIPVKNLKTGIATRDEHLRAENWLNEAKFPEIKFASADIQSTNDKKTKWKAKGKITIKGVTKDLTATVTVRAIPEKLWKKLGSGEWVRVKTKFDVKVSDFGVKIPDGVGPKVSDTWSISFDCFATSTKPKK